MSSQPRVASRWLALLAVVFAGATAQAQPSAVDADGVMRLRGEEPPEVIVLTFGVGPVVFEKFGHAALCLRYKSTGLEPLCFNYGVTDFNEGSIMIWHFLRTEQKFKVDGEAWSSMLRFYRYEDRDIWMQQLELQPEQARKIEAKLFYDIQEAHRYYYYDHFFDNCTTRLRDMIDDAVGGKLREGTDAPYPMTFRQLGRRGMAEFPPLIAIADYVLGRQLDDTPTLWESMFHPDMLRQQLEVRLGVKPRQLYKRRGIDFPTDGSTARLPMFAIALLFGLPLLVATWRRRFHKAALIWSTVFLTFWGVVIWSLVIISSIKGVRWNEAVFVMVPFDVALPFLGPDKRRSYARVRVAILLVVSALCAIGVFHQPLWIPILSAIVPLSIIGFDLPHPLLAKRETGSR